MPFRKLQRHLLHQQAATMSSVCNLRSRQAIRAEKLERPGRFRPEMTVLVEWRKFLFIFIDASSWMLTMRANNRVTVTQHRCLAGLSSAT